MLINPPLQADRRSPLELSVSYATSADQADWDGYIDRHPDGTVFHRWAWRNILAESFKYPTHFIIARRGRQIVGVLPLAEVRTLLFGHAIVSLPFCSWAGPIADDDAALHALDREAALTADRAGVTHLEYRLIGAAKFDRPVQDLYVRFVRSISGSHEANLHAVPRKQRAMIRKGISNRLSSAIETVEDFYPLYAENVHRHGTPCCPRRFFHAMAAALGSDCEVLIVRDDKGEAVSGVLSLFHRDQVFPFYAGDSVAARSLAANDFKYWEVMRRAADRGARQFDFGRSKTGTGSFHFKKNWGFDHEPLSYEFRLRKGVAAMPQNNPLNPKYQKAIALWRKLPPWAVNAAGPVLVRGLG